MVAVNYDWDELEDNIDEEYDDAGSPVAEYTTEPYLYGDLISQRRDSQSCFHCFDGQGSTTVLTVPSGDPSDVYAYTSFGERSERTGSVTNPHQYIGQLRGHYLPTSQLAIKGSLSEQHYGVWMYVLGARDLLLGE